MVPGRKTTAEFTFSGVFALAPSTTYWVVLGGGVSVGNGEVYWSLTNSGRETPGSLPGWVISDARSLNAGLGWTTQVGPGQMAVVVPEPSGAMLLGLGALSLISRRRR